MKSTIESFSVHYQSFKNTLCINSPISNPYHLISLELQAIIVFENNSNSQFKMSCGLCYMVINIIPRILGSNTRKDALKVFLTLKISFFLSIQILKGASECQDPIHIHTVAVSVFPLSKITITDTQKSSSANGKLSRWDDPTLQHAIPFVKTQLIRNHQIIIQIFIGSFQYSFVTTTHCSDLITSLKSRGFMPFSSYSPQVLVT